jgi:hypothetical protein
VRPPSANLKQRGELFWGLDSGNVLLPFKPFPDPLPNGQQVIDTQICVGRAYYVVVLQRSKFFRRMPASAPTETCSGYHDVSGRDIRGRKCPTCCSIIAYGFQLIPVLAIDFALLDRLLYRTDVSFLLTITTAFATHHRFPVFPHKHLLGSAPYVLISGTYVLVVSDADMA